jgi:hypothetical protein
MFTHKFIVVMFSWMAVTLVGLTMAPSAFALPEGPFWVHKSPQEKIETPERFKGSGGEQLLVVGSVLQVLSNRDVVKGSIFNGPHQGLMKLEITYIEPKVLTFPECAVVLGNNNTVQVKGSLVWKWDMLTKQLEEEKPTAEQTPGVDFSGTEPVNAPGGQQSEIFKYTNTGVFMTVTLASCRIAGTYVINGSVLGELNLPINVYSKTLSIRNRNGGQEYQHFFNPVQGIYLGIELGLTLGESTGFIRGQNNIETAGESKIVE